MSPPFLLGINYWPRRSAMAMWSRFDIGEIDEDFARIAAMGMRVVRFFLTWEAFQPAPDTIDETALRRLEEVIERAAKHRLTTMPTFFTGHMSGVNWLPAWTLDSATGNGRFRTISGGVSRTEGIGDFYTGELLQAQRHQARIVGRRLRGHPAVAAWDLGNEFSNLREPKRPEDAARWSAALSEDLREASGLPVTGGLHGEDLSRDRAIRPASISAPWAYTTMHGYSVYSDFARGRLDTDVVPFLSEIAAACSKKPVLFSEFGNPTCPPGKRSPYDRVPLPGEPPVAPLEPGNTNLDAPSACLDEREMALYATAVLDKLQRRGALGAFWWCWADYARELRSTPPFDLCPHELSFGIVRDDGSEKPVCAALSKFAAERRRVAAPQPPIVEQSSFYAGLPGSLHAAYESYVKC